MFARLLFVGMLVIASPLATGQQIYKWVDASGNVTYSSTPPPGAAARPVDLPPAPPPAEIEAARQREQSLQELGNQMSQDRQQREAQFAQEQAASGAAVQPPAPPLQDSGVDTDGGWWIPAYPWHRRDIHPPRPPLGPVRPPPGQDPTDNPAYWPREPVVPPGPRPRPMPLR
jgi:Domain of unknown function (DUF4124)